jgi:SAM-dependent methyltransferase
MVDACILTARHAPTEVPTTAVRWGYDPSRVLGQGEVRVSGVRPCDVCGVGVLEPFLEVGTMPVHVGVLWQDAASARACAMGPMTLSLCRSCGWVYNTDFDVSLIDYSQKYDNALHASPLFQTFERDLAEHLLTRYDLHGGTVAEIGCGSGHFLGLLTGLARGRGLGFDPSHDPDHVDPLADGHVTFIRGEYPGVGEPPAVDLLVCRQTLEHIPDPSAFLRTVRDALQPNPETVVYFEVPNSTMPFRELSIWDLIYEHCTYFVEPSLRFLFEATGFEVLDVRETYEGQFLSLEARPSREPHPPTPPGPAGLDGLVDATAAFAMRFDDRRRSWQARLSELRQSGQRAVVWGGGARAVSFFNLLDVSQEVAGIVDINPRKQGTYLGGTGQPIVAPESLVELEPDLVIVLNDLYRDEITAALHELGLFPKVVAA